MILSGNNICGCERDTWRLRWSSHTCPIGFRPGKFESYSTWEISLLPNSSPTVRVGCDLALSIKMNSERITPWEVSPHSNSGFWLQNPVRNSFVIKNMTIIRMPPDDNTFIFIIISFSNAGCMIFRFFYVFPLLLSSVAVQNNF